MIDRLTVDRIISSADIIDVIGDFVTLKRKGVNYQACCPFHNEKTPSFVVSPAKGYYKCFGCGKGGNVVGFVMEHENMAYPEALKYLAKKYGIEVQEKEQTEDQRKDNDERESMMALTSYAATYFADNLTTAEGKNIGLSYLYERGFSDAIIKKFGLGYNPSKGDDFSITALKAGYKEEFLIRTGLTIAKESGGYYDRFAGRVIFPISGISGRVIAFGGRTLRTDKKVAKYLNSPESDIYHKSNTLYGINHAKKAITQENRCILVEGYTDVLQFFQSGIENVVASSGTSLTTEQIKLISRFTRNVTVIYDGDSAGIKASMRGIDMILAQGLNVRVVLLPEGEDPDSFARSHSQSELNDFIISSEENFLSFKTKLLLRDTKDDPIGRAAVITDVVSTISVIPDEIVRTEFIKECSRLLDTDEAIITREVTRKQAFASGGAQGLNVALNREKKERFLSRKEQPFLEDPFMPVDDRPMEVFSSMDFLEKELLTYLIRYGEKDFYFYQHKQEPVKMNVARTIIEEIRVDTIEFRQPLYKELFDEYIYLYEENSSAPVPIERFVNHQEITISEFAINLLTKEEAYRPSGLWSKHDDDVLTEKDNLDIAIPKTITLYKLKVIEIITENLRRELTREGITDEQSLEILSRIGALAASRKAICDKYSRII